MPLYLYRCTECQKEFEDLRDYKDQNSAHCPDCGGKVKTMITRPTVKVFRPFWHPGMDFHPQFIGSRAEFKRKCKEFGVTAPDVDFKHTTGAPADGGGKGRPFDV